MLMTLRRRTAPLFAHLGAAALRVPPLRRSIGLTLWQFLDRYVSFFGVEATKPTRFGPRLHISSEPRVENEIFYFGEWEPLLTRHLLDREPDDGVFVDVGANIGYFTLLAAQRFAEVHTVEASPHTLARLRENIARNSVENVVVHPVAIGPARGRVAFFADEAHRGGSSLEPGDGRVFECEVEMLPLADILTGVDPARLRFFKVDVEGAEPAVLAGITAMAGDLSAGTEVLVEYHPEKSDALWPAVEALQAAGFDLFVLQGAYDRAEYTDQGRRSAMAPITARPTSFCDILLRKR
ncbi:MAG: FkbM family methyltransferase [Pseudomonadota bacterium]